jgi:hypothetical protein
MEAKGAWNPGTHKGQKGTQGRLQKAWGFRGQPAGERKDDGLAEKAGMLQRSGVLACGPRR